MTKPKIGISESEKNKIITELQTKQATLSCPRCKNNQFTILDGYLNQSVQSQLGGLVIGGPSIPTVAVVCNNCGFLSQHVMGVLGLLSKQNKKNGDKKT